MAGISPLRDFLTPSAVIGLSRVGSFGVARLTIYR